MPRVRPVQDSHSGRFRCRPQKRTRDVCRRAAGRSGGSAGGSVCWPCRGDADKALEDAGIPRRDVYVTNAVKHFKWEPRGKRRIHKKPRISEIKACRPWLEAELRAVKPQVVVLLGATAAQSIMGPQFKLMQNRGKLLQTPGPVGRDLPVERVVATIHPSAVLRAPDSEGRRTAYESLVADLKVVARALRAGS
jgi:uracil-DNA glycosylase